MDEMHFKHILGEMPPPQPGSVEIYAGDKVGIFIPKVEMDFSEATHCHGGYEFVVPFAASHPFKVENRTLIMEKNKLFPLNPEQTHRAVVKTENPAL